MKLTSYIDRNYNLLFHKEWCVKILIDNPWFKYNDIMTNGFYTMRYLGNDWFKILKESLPHDAEHRNLIMKRAAKANATRNKSRG